VQNHRAPNAGQGTILASDRLSAFVEPTVRFDTQKGERVMPHSKPLAGKRLLVFVGDIYEDLELWYPKIRMEEAGAEVVVAGPEAGAVYSGKHGYPCQSDAAIRDMDAADFDGVICPGGFMPDKLRRDEKVLSLVREFDKAGKLVAAICHGGWIPISARVYDGVKTTGSRGIKDDLENAGAIWEDTSVVIDRHFVSSRSPHDLADFCHAIIAVLAGGKKTA
jgi:protease I